MTQYAAEVESTEEPKGIEEQFVSIIQKGMHAQLAATLLPVLKALAHPAGPVSLEIKVSVPVENGPPAEAGYKMNVNEQVLLGDLTRYFVSSFGYHAPKALGHEVPPMNQLGIK